MALISKECRILFILNPRTGSTAVASALAQATRAEYIPPQVILDEAGYVKVPRKHSTMHQLLRERLLTREDLNGFTIFTTVRNPFDSLVSIWAKKRVQYAELAEQPDFFGHKIRGFMDDITFIRDHTFSDWVRRHYGPLRDQGRTASLNRKHFRGCNAHLRFENLQEDIAELMKSIGGPELVVPVLNETIGREKDHRQYYDTVLGPSWRKYFSGISSILAIRSKVLNEGISYSPSVPNLKFAVLPICRWVRDLAGRGSNVEPATCGIGFERARTRRVAIIGGSTQHCVSFGAVRPDCAGLRRRRTK
jgi:hypothetical protein